MPNPVNSKGFYKSKELLSKNHSLYANFVENIHNMEHNELWKLRHDENSEPIKFGTFYRETENGDKYFLFATNMKRNFENLNAEFTPYRHDQKEINTVSTHGYGGIALPLKIGGQMHIYFSNKNEYTTKHSDYEELSMNIDAFMEIAKSNDVSQELPSPSYTKKIPNHFPMICFSDSIWEEELRDHFKKMNYKTYYVFYNPNLGNTNMEVSIQDYLKQEINESFQNQFIEQLNEGHIVFNSSYEKTIISSDEKKIISSLPYCFYEKIKETIVTIRGTDINDSEIIEFMRPRPIDINSNTLYWKYGTSYGKVEFENNSNSIKSSAKIQLQQDEFNADFQVKTGVLDDAEQCYSDSFNTLEKEGYTLEIERQGIFSEGVFVDVGDIPLTCMPMSHYIDDSSHLIGNRKRRTFVKIYPENFNEWKESIHPTEMKEDAAFTQGSILLKAIEFLVKRYDSSRPKNNPRKNMIDVLDIDKNKKDTTKKATQKGNEFEHIEIASLLATISDTVLINGDNVIKRQFKLRNQGIDHMLKFNDSNLTILIQTKLQKRTHKDKIQSYVASVKEYKEKFNNEKVYSLFINGEETAIKTHYSLMNDIVCNSCIFRLKTETTEQFKQKIVNIIENVHTVFAS